MTYLKIEGVEKRYQHMGVFPLMTDTSGLYQRLSVYDNLRLYADLYGISQKDNRIDKVLEIVNLTEAGKTSGKVFERNDTAGAFGKSVSPRT
ncbi:P-loop NTPase family protein [Salibacterium aidingense]|uniref:hypothetical protein n=1 Tax=Salibacterium aidingense TaxID=384933 RepID=UPI000688779C|nr:hypothetical protein [Salibacterium aidingense]